MRIALVLLILSTTASISIATQPPPDLGQSAQALVNNLATGRYHEVFASFGTQMQGALPESKLGPLWQSLKAQLGKLDKVGEVRVMQGGGYTIALVHCSFTAAEIDAKVVYDGEGKVGGLFFLPHEQAPPHSESTRPAGIREREITVGAEPWKLSATLTFPDGEGPFPALVLVHGSGPQDRDETLGANKPFRDLAWGLAAKGIAVLRYEKRTHAYAKVILQRVPRLTLQEETVEDACAAVATLGQQPEISRNRIFVLGHSLGGYAAPRIAETCSGLQGLVVLAGSTRPLEQVIVEQLKYLAKLDGTVSEQEAQQIAAAQQARKEIESPDLAPDDVVMVLGAKTPGSYWIDLRNYNPATEAASLKIPMLILQGDRDYQVTEADLSIWQAALKGRDDVQIRRFQDLNHLFMKGEGRPSPADYEKAGHIAPEVIETIADWISDPHLKGLSHE